MNSKIIIIGSTGKLGSKLLNFSNKYNIDIHAVTCFNNEKKLLKQKKKYKINTSFVLSRSNDYKNFLKVLTNKIDIIYFLDFGSKSLLYLDIFLNNNSKSIIAVANKEMIIAGGRILFEKIKKTKNTFIPLDSEHFSLKNSFPNQNINKLFITASGGPFFFKKNVNLDKVNLSQVLAHPKWKMGKNNSIDSSNFVNKVLEIFELTYIYNFPISKIDFLVSKEAFIHSIIEYSDGIITINTFKNDMIISLTYPLVKFFDIQIKLDSKKYLFSPENFTLNYKRDNRFNFFKYYNKIKKFDHHDQIKFMILNNYAQYLYLSNSLNYQGIIPFIMNSMSKFKSKPKINNLKSIVNYVNLIRSKFYND